MYSYNFTTHGGDECPHTPPPSHVRHWEEGADDPDSLKILKTLHNGYIFSSDDYSSV